MIAQCRRKILGVVLVCLLVGLSRREEEIILPPGRGSFGEEAAWLPQDKV